MLLCPRFKTYSDDPNKGYMFVKFSNTVKEKDLHKLLPALNATQWYKEKYDNSQLLKFAIKNQ